MVLPIVFYGHPVLRAKGARIEKVTPDIQALIRDMLETMEENHGVGLAAQQVGKALQLTVIDVRPVTDRPSWVEMDGQRVDPNRLMPLVLINPQITLLGESETGPEGCLSFPELFAEIARPESVEVKATNGEGKPLTFRCGGLLARAVQHEVDHLNGILFIDRMTSKDKQTLRDELDALQAETRARLPRSGPGQ
ncbi:MAG: peptide deformylase [Verrucomicrobia bacterium]|jgi:peptide deformylase|nr:peptide deformylase [Verrucomicrobiota bacterium]